MQNFQKSDILTATQSINRLGVGKYKQKIEQTKDAQGAFCLGIAFFYGIEVEQDFERSAEWFEKTAQWGYIRGFYGAGLCGAREEDFEYAEKMFNLGLENGDYYCAMALGNYYETLEEDNWLHKIKKTHLQKALQFYNTAIEGSVPEAVYYKAVLLATKLKKADEAFPLFKLRFEECPDDIANAYFYASSLESKEFEEAVNIHLILADKGLKESQHIVAVAMYDGRISGTPEMVMGWLRRAASQNYAPSQSFIAMLYDIGYSYSYENIDSPELLEKAYTWIRRAIKNGSENYIFMKQLTEKMTTLNIEIPIDNDQAFFDKSKSLFDPSFGFATFSSKQKKKTKEKK